MKHATRYLELRETARVPWDGLILGWGAMLPFAILGAWAWAASADAAEAPRAAARVWGAALLLFFSGVRRGLSFRTEGGPTTGQVLASICLFLAGLMALLVPVSWALAIVALALAILGLLDTRAARRGEVPLYFSSLRPWQMSFAVIAAGLCWAAG